MMFTDEELQKLKERMTFAGQDSLFTPLIARLEAADLCAESLDDVLHHGVKYPNGVMHEADPELAKERLDVWRRKAGKDAK